MPLELGRGRGGPPERGAWLRDPDKGGTAPLACDTVVASLLLYLCSSCSCGQPHVEYQALVRLLTASCKDESHVSHIGNPGKGLTCF